MTRAGPSGGPARVGVPGVRRQDAGSALDLAGLEARCADVETLRGHTGRAHQSLHALDVGVPAALGAAVRVRDVVTEARSLAADVAVGRHGYLLKFDVDEMLSSTTGSGRRTRGRASPRSARGEPVKSSRRVARTTKRRRRRANGTSREGASGLDELDGVRGTVRRRVDGERVQLVEPDEIAPAGVESGGVLVGGCDAVEARAA